MVAGALSDLKIIELADFITGPYCAKVLADLGAEVIKVEPPTGDTARRWGPFGNDVPHPERSGLFLYLNTSKLGVTLDIDTGTGRDLLRRLVATADIIVENYPPGWIEDRGLGYDALSAENPGLIMTSITPFGQTGPYREFLATDLVSLQTGGLGYGIPGDIEDPQLPPLKACGEQAEFLAGMMGALATMHAVFAREQDGRGSHVDVSTQAAVACGNFGNVATYDYEGRVPSRLRAEGSQGTTAITFSCKDGDACFVLMEERQWRDWVDVMGKPDWTTDPRFRDHEARMQNREALEAFLGDWCRQYTKAEVYRLAQAKRIPIMPIHTMDEVVRSPQLQARGFFRELRHPIAGNITYPGAPYQFSETPWQFTEAAPTLGQHNELVFGERLGYPRESLVRLRQAGIV